MLSDAVAWLHVMQLICYMRRFTLQDGVSTKELDGSPLEDGDFPLTQVCVEDDQDFPMTQPELAQALREQLDEFVDVISDDEPDPLACSSAGLVACLRCFFTLKSKAYQCNACTKPATGLRGLRAFFFLLTWSASMIQGCSSATCCNACSPHGRSPRQR